MMENDFQHKLSVAEMNQFSSVRLLRAFASAILLLSNFIMMLIAFKTDSVSVLYLLRSFYSLQCRDGTDVFLI